MGYVMVPVPEEHVQQVMQFVLRAVERASIQPWDQESVSKVFAEVDEVSRSLLAFVARASVAGRELPEPEAARMVELSAREIFAIVRELNDQGREHNRPSLILRRTTSETLPNGRVTEVRVLSMAEDVAPLVAVAEREDARAGGGPVP